MFSYCFQPHRSSTPNSANPLLYPVIEGAAHSPRRSRRQSCRPTAGGRNLNHMSQRCRRGPLGRGPLSLTATAILLRENRNRDSLLQFEALQHPASPGTARAASRRVVSYRNSVPRWRALPAPSEPDPRANLLAARYPQRSSARRRRSIHSRRVPSPIPRSRSSNRPMA
jgi:hypothetical protein